MTCPRCHGQHWLLEPPNGERIHGKCKGCGYPATWPAEPRIVQGTLGHFRRGPVEQEA